jgi:hypothetical protein
MPETVYFKGKVIIGRKVGDKVYVRIDVYTNEGGKELARYIGKEIAGIAVVIEGDNK